MKTKKTARILLTLILMSALIFLSVMAYNQLLELEVSIPNTFVFSLVLVLLIFLLILIVRFLFLLSFSYLDAVESLTTPYEEYTPLISILIPAYNEGKVVSDSIEAMLNLDYPQYELIIINDGSSDDTYQRALKYKGRHGNAIIKIVNKANSGKADSLNRGLEVATGELVVSVDADSKLGSDTLKSLTRHFNDPTVGAVAGNVKVINRNNFWTRLQALEYIEGLNLSKRAQGFLRIVNIIPGPLGMFRRNVINEVGGYSSDTFAEDCDLTLKILSNNWKIKYEPLSISETEAPENLKDVFKQRYRWTRGIIQSVWKHRKKVLLPFKNFSTSFTLWMMIFESLLWPVMNIFAHLFLIFVAINYGFTPILVLWWCLLTVLDMAIALHCVTMENESFALVPYSFFYRLFYILAIDICKFFALIEEIMGIKMVWGKVERKGRL